MLILDLEEYLNLWGDISIHKEGDYYSWGFQLGYTTAIKDFLKQVNRLKNGGQRQR